MKNFLKEKEFSVNFVFIGLFSSNHKLSWYVFSLTNFKRVYKSISPPKIFLDIWDDIVICEILMENLSKKWCEYKTASQINTVASPFVSGIGLVHSLCLLIIVYEKCLLLCALIKVSGSSSWNSSSKNPVSTSIVSIFLLITKWGLQYSSFPNFSPLNRLQGDCGLILNFCIISIYYINKTIGWE